MDSIKKLRLKKKPIFIVGIVLLLVIVMIIGFYFLFVPKLSLIGDKHVTLVYGNKYEEEGCKASYFGKDISDKVWYESNIDDTKLGTYEVKCKIRKNRIVVTKSREVDVVDETKPVITLVGNNEVFVCPNGTYTEEGYSAIDDYDGDITSRVEFELKFQ